MKKVLPFVIALILAISAFGQQQTPTAEASPNQENDVVKISTKLVQVDAIVVDKDGNQVRDLSQADFEVLEDGKPQKITNFSYINTEAGQSAPPIKSKEKTEVKIKNAPIPPPVKITNATTGRIITFIVDDGNCSVSNIGMRASREGVQKFIREQMLPTDRVAIYQTRSGSSALQQYTNDKARLLKVAGKIRWIPPMGSCSTTSDGSFYAAAKSNTYIKRGALGTTTNTIESDEERRTREHVEDRLSSNQIVGTLGLMRYVIQGLQRAPGRKIMFLLSDGLSVYERNGRSIDAVGPMKELTELANRSSVVINTMDVRGVFDENMIEARDEVYSQDDPLATEKIGADRSNIVSNSREGLDFLARETGGKFTRNKNFLDGPIKENLALETGYYLIAYEPSDETFKGKKFNKIEIKVNVPDLKVVSRAGFFGYVEQTAKPKTRKTEDSDLYEAISAPLPQAGIDVLLTAYFVNSPETGNLVRSFFRIDGNALTFVDEGGLKKASFDVVAVTLNEKNKVVDEFTHTNTYKVQAEAIPVILQNGLIYSTDVLVKKPGTYNFRVAVKDAASKQIGTSSQMVEIPDLKKSNIFVSGLTVSQVDKAGKFTVPAAPNTNNPSTLTMTPAVPAIRRFSRNSILAYAYTIYSAKLDPATGQPKLSIQTKLYYNGELVMDGKPQNAQLETQTDWTRIKDFGYLQLKPQMAAGDYNIQIIITDLLANGKNAITSQSVDFEVVE